MIGLKMKLESYVSWYVLLNFTDYKFLFLKATSGKPTTIDTSFDQHRKSNYDLNCQNFIPPLNLYKLGILNALKCGIVHVYIRTCMYCVQFT